MMDEYINITEEDITEGVEKETPTNNSVLGMSELREKLIGDMAARLYQDEIMLQKAVDYCLKRRNQGVSMEEYVRRHFGYLITKFEDLRVVYIAAAKNLHLKQKKLRRNKNRK